MYVVHPRDGEGCSWTLHRNYLLPISNNLGQAENENSVEGVGPKDEPTPVTQTHSELPADGPAKGQLESLPNLPPKQYEPVHSEVAGSGCPRFSK